MVNTPRIPPVDLGKVLSVFNATTQNQILTYPKALLQIPLQTLVQGLVTGIDTQGNLLLQTPQGSVAVKTSLPLPQGATVQIQVTHTNGQLQFQLVTVNNKPVTEAFVLPPAPEGSPQQAKQSQLFLFKTPATTPQPVHQPVTSTIITTVSNATSLPLLQGTVVSPKPEALKTLLQSFTFQPGTNTLIPTNQPSPSLPNEPAFLQSGQVIGVRILASTPPTVPTAGTPITAPTVVLPNTAIPLPEGTPLPNHQPVFAPGKFPYANPPLPHGLVANETNIPTPAPPTTAASQAPSPTPAGTPPAPTSQTPPLPTQQAPLTPLPQQGNTTVTVPPQPGTPATTTQPLAQTTPQTSTTPTPPLPTQPSPLPGQLPQVSGQVVAQEPTGETVVQTPIGTIRFATSTPIPKDTQITFELVTFVPASALAAKTLQAANQDGEESIPQLFKHWKTLENIIKTPEGQQNQPGHASLLGRIPVPDKNLGGRILHFMAAVQSGDIEQWLGKEAVQTLQRGENRPFVEQLVKEFSTLHKLFTEPAPATWHSLAFPVYDGQQLQQGRLFVRYQNEDEGSGTEKPPSHTRFIVEVDLNKLGSMQFDGLVSHRQPNKHFDLVIRSQSSLLPEMQQDIRTLFTTSQEMTGLRGKLSFEVANPFPVLPAQEVLQGQGYGDSAASLMV